MQSWAKGFEQSWEMLMALPGIAQRKEENRGREIEQKGK
jgi:hypothetical protein